MPCILRSFVDVSPVQTFRYYVIQCVVHICKVVFIMHACVADLIEPFRTSRTYCVHHPLFHLKHQHIPGS